ncbi:hypothetical protein HanRHA438_Chr14g0672351 [Helianthus annuus]|nr:hypothetical protein HanRHA438_Chr14g0672351 [Helianthus annuus]
MIRVEYHPPSFVVDFPSGQHPSSACIFFFERALLDFYRLNYLPLFSLRIFFFERSPPGYFRLNYSHLFSLRTFFLLGSHRLLELLVFFLVSLL